MAHTKDEQDHSMRLGPQQNKGRDEHAFPTTFLPLIPPPQTQLFLIVDIM